MKKPVRINFTNFWSGFDNSQNFFCQLLQSQYRVELVDKPEFLIYSVFGKEHRKYRCIRIFFTGENCRPNFYECDYALSFDHLDHPRHRRLPLYVLYFDGHPECLVKPTGFDPGAVLRQKTKFCNFIFSNDQAGERILFFKRLSQYKRVDSGGRVLNNIGGRVPDKLAFIRDYKFTIAFENASYPGYTTEKLTDPMRVHSLPIYWGNPLVERDFNPRSFLNYHDFPDEDALIERIIELDQNDDLYLEYLREPYFHNNEPNIYCRPDYLLEFFERIFRERKPPIARKPWYEMQLSLQRRHSPRQW
jgi:hypothetical protein